MKKFNFKKIQLTFPKWKISTWIIVGTIGFLAIYQTLFAFFFWSDFMLKQQLVLSASESLGALFWALWAIRYTETQTGKMKSSILKEMGITNEEIDTYKLHVIPMIKELSKIDMVKAERAVKLGLKYFDQFEIPKDWEIDVNEKAESKLKEDKNEKSEVSSLPKKD